MSFFFFLRDQLDYSILSDFVAKTKTKWGHEKAVFLITSEVKSLQFGLSEEENQNDEPGSHYGKLWVRFPSQVGRPG